MTILFEGSPFPISSSPLKEVLSKTRQVNHLLSPRRGSIYFILKVDEFVRQLLLNLLTFY